MKNAIIAAIVAAIISASGAFATATQVYSDQDAQQNVRIAKLERKVVRLQNNIGNIRYELARLNRTVTDFMYCVQNDVCGPR